jgi:hypothetical protein
MGNYDLHNWYQGATFVYINDHSVFNSFTENAEAFFKWMFLDQL